MRVDRIADPWGPATPVAAGEAWPARVDTHLMAGSEPDRWVQTASILHSNGDAYDVAVQGGRLVGVRGRAVDRVNRGRLGPKDLFAWQANHAADRLTTPLVRDGGELREASWDKAMGAIVERSRALLAERGPSALGFLHERPALPRGVLHAGDHRPRGHRDQPPRRQHAPVHGDGR